VNSINKKRKMLKTDFIKGNAHWFGIDLTQLSQGVEVETQISKLYVKK